MSSDLIFGGTKNSKLQNTSQILKGISNKIESPKNNFKSSNHQIKSCNTLSNWNLYCQREEERGGERESEREKRKKRER
jgi:hypothetical protein